ncbi:MAG: dihydrofolate reductase family protein [Angustibacter sp.]
MRANFISTLDGGARGDNGRTDSINDPADHRVFALLRALSDVILVGAGTARDEGYGRASTPARWQDLRTAHGLAEPPTIAVVSRSLDLPSALLDATPDAAGTAVVHRATRSTTRRRRAVRRRPAGSAGRDPARTWRSGRRRSAAEGRARRAAAGRRDAGRGR